MTESEKSQEKVASRARNLYVVSLGIIVYLVAGADLGALSALGLRAPTLYPSVLRFSAVVALGWFSWRYWVAWRLADSRLYYRTKYLQTLHRSYPYLDLILESVERYRIIARNTEKPKTLIRLGSGSMELPNTVLEVGPEGDVTVDVRSRPHPSKRREVIIDGLILASEETIDWTNETVTIPFWAHYWVSLRFGIRFAFAHEDFADLWLPLFVASIAIVLLILKVFGADPAGVWGLLREPGILPPPAYYR